MLRSRGRGDNNGTLRAAHDRHGARVIPRARPWTRARLFVPLWDKTEGMKLKKRKTETKGDDTEVEPDEPGERPFPPRRRCSGRRAEVGPLPGAGGSGGSCLIQKGVKGAGTSRDTRHKGGRGGKVWRSAGFEESSPN